MLQLKNKKYSDMTTEQLLALRNRILFNLENEVKHHVRQWEARIEQIDEVLKYKGFEQ
jgi:3-hydroxyacyl-CoA dehydrogenase